MISVIIPTYNRGQLIQRAINSIIQQTYGPLEIIIIDDGSNDNTENIVHNIDSDNIIYIKQKNQGACSARNRGIIEAKGDYIAFLDSDDEWKPDMLEKQIKHINNINADISVCNYFVEENNKFKKAIVNKKTNTFTLDELLNRNYITTGAILIKKELIKEVGMFDENMPRYQDWELMLRIANKMEIPFLDELLLVQHVQQKSITRSTSKEKKYYALKRILEKNGNNFQKNLKAYAHIHWSMGMYSMFMKNHRWDFLWKGVTMSKFNFKRFLIYILLKTPMRNLILKKYSIKH